jgi:peptide/nickel transport system substrate-binding protein
MPGYLKPPSSGDDGASGNSVNEGRDDSVVDDARRRFVQAAGAVGLGGVTSLAGCAGSEQSSSSDTKVPEIQVVGETQERGIVHFVLKFWAETVNEETPFEVNFQPMKHTQVVEKLMFEQSVHMGSLTFGPRPHRLDPHMLLNDIYHSDNQGCGTYQWTSYSDPKLDKLLDKQASQMDRKKRQKSIHEIQKKLATLGGDGEFGSVRGLIHPQIVQLYNKDLFGGITVVNGQGIRNIWTYNETKPKTDQTRMVIPVTIGANNLTPLFSGALNLEAVRNVYDKLTQIGPDGSAKPWLATEWEVADNNKEITFQLRENHSFHDGEPVTAEHVAFTYDYMENSPFLGSAVEPIESTEAVDKTTVKFTLKEPFAPVFLFTFSRVPIIPKHVWQDIPDSVDATKAVEWSPSSEGKFFGSGNYKFKHWRKGEEVAIEANPDHFRPPGLDEIVFRLVKSSQVALDSMSSGDAHLLYTADASRSVIQEVGNKNDHLATKEILSMGNHPLIFNTNAPPFGFEEVRAALESVAPKQTITEEVWSGFAEPAFGNISPAVPFWFNENQKKWGMSYTGKETFTKVLEDAGFGLKDDGVYYPEGEVPDHSEPLGCEVHNN